MIRIHSTVAGALVAGLLVTGAAYGQGPRGGGPGGRAGAAMGRGMAGGLPLGSLNLTQAQQDLIRDIRERGREEARQFDTRLRAARDAQRAAVEAIPPNDGQIRAATLALGEVQADMAVHQARVQNEIFAALTAEQQEQVRKLRAERQQRLAQRQAQTQQRRQQRRSQ